MARASSAAQQRTLTLTEELEKLEQQITLTLQEIDHNFSRAHRIVTASILPVVEQYAQHSKDVWEGSKFWKQFFESSANVSLSGYEEPNTEDDVTVTDDSKDTTHVTLETSESFETPSAQHISTSSIQDLDVSEAPETTPRPAKHIEDHTATFADYPSPYEALRQEIHNTTGADATLPSRSFAGPSTPGKQSLANIAQTPQTSPFLPQQPSLIPRPSTTRKKTDPLLHRVLDRTYRIQATPLTNRYDLPPSKPQPAIGTTPATTSRTTGHGRGGRDQHLLSSSPSSSPSLAPPQLNTALFSSPRHTRTPGVSVLTPATKRTQPTQFPKKAQAQAQKSTPIATQHTPASKSTTQGGANIWSSDSSDSGDEFDAGMSPPKTIQFHIPQSRSVLLRTPAQDVGGRIVRDVLSTAGVANTPQGRGEDDIDIDIDMDIDAYGDGYEDADADWEQERMENEAMGDQTSPSVVRRVDLGDESF